MHVHIHTHRTDSSLPAAGSCMGICGSAPTDDWTPEPDNTDTATATEHTAHTAGSTQGQGVVASPVSDARELSQINVQMTDAKMQVRGEARCM